MGARSGNSYLSTMRKLKTRTRFKGEWIPDPISHPAFVRQARLLASLYDAQSERPALMTHQLADGDRIGWSYTQPSSIPEVRKRSLMLRVWAEQSAISESPTPDAANLILAALAAAQSLFAAVDAHFAENLVNYYLTARRRDWCITTLADTAPSFEATPTAHPTSQLTFTTAASRELRVDGVATLTLPGCLADEVLLLPLCNDNDRAEVALGALPSNSSGLSFECTRNPARPDALDCRMLCDHVALPTDRVFLLATPARCRAMLAQTSAWVATLYQSLLRALARARLIAAGAIAPLTADSEITRPSRSAVKELEEALNAAEEEAAPDRWGSFVAAAAPLERMAEAMRVSRAAV